MFKINFEVLINAKNFKLLSARHTSFYQLRFTIDNQSCNKKKSYPLIPYLILTPEQNSSQFSQLIKNQQSNQQVFARQNSTQNKNNSSLQAQNNSKINLSEIDSETNSFLTKTFLVRQVDHSIPIQDIIVFKGSMEVSHKDFLREIQNKKNLHKLYITCELFLVSSFTTEVIGEWYSYTLAEEGNAGVSISFFSYNSSYAQAEITFLWTSIQFIELNGKQSLQSNQIVKLQQYIERKYKNLYDNILSIPEQFISSKQSLKKTLINKNTQSSMQSLKLTINSYNQETNKIWKQYQQFQQKTFYLSNLSFVALEFFKRKVQKYNQTLQDFHWKNNIIVTQEILAEQNDQSQRQSIKGEEQLKESLQIEEANNKKMPKQLFKLKRDPQIDSNLVLYPFAEHQRMIKLSNDDFKKISGISSLSKRFHNSSYSSKDSSQKPIHLIIFVHGYQASGFDMQNLAAFLRYKNPQKIRTYVSSCNEGRTQQPLQESGHRLAVQIKNYINNKFEFDQFEISFVCHSMGGIIVRAALKYLQLYKNKFRTFLSLCSPHLGYLYHTSALIKTSLWVLNQVRKDPSMLELTMQDNSVLEKTFLYELSKKTQLSWFKYPIFIGSREDEYVPFWSALVRDKDFFFETNDAKVYKTLYRNFTQKIEPKIIRLQAIYRDKINDISSFVGRTAHIRILNCIQVMEMIYLLIQKAL